MTTQRLITQALPYANGELHLGHLEEAILADIHVRRLKRRAAATNEEILYVCGDDQHGSAITLRARAEGVSPEALIERLRVSHLEDFGNFHVQFDHYHATHSEQNRAWCETVYARLKEAGLIYKAQVQQLFDPSAGLFLADRLVKGACPACKAPGQYGDGCESCGSAHRALDLIDPVSQLSGARPEARASEHLFFKLSDTRVSAFCRQWARAPGRLPPDALNKLSEWLDGDLRDWDISRDGPYFGFEIPGEEDKFFYVWLDAPLGYFAAAQARFEALGQPERIDELTRPDSAWEITHIIGKDILYFHALFWPAVLHFSGFRTPSAIKTHGFLTYQGRKLSKSKGTLVSAKAYLAAGLDPEWLRFYFFSKLNGSSEDFDFSERDFTQKIDSDLVGKYANLGSRLAPFAKLLSPAEIKDCSAHPLILFAQALEAPIQSAFEALDFARAHRLILSIAEEANRWVNDQQPWLLAKDPQRREKLARAVSAGLCAFECVTRHLSPVIPSAAERALAFLGASLDGRAASSPIEAGRVLGVFEPLARRVDPAALRRLFSDPS